MATDSTSTASADPPTEPIHVDGDTELDELSAEHDVVLTDFYADWCGPCQMLEPVLETLAAETDAVIAKVDVDENQQLAGAYGVQGVPTLVLFAEGKQVEKVVGAQSEAQLRTLVTSYTS